MRKAVGYLARLVATGIAGATTSLTSLLIGIILGGDCEPHEVSDGMTPCLDVSDTWVNMSFLLGAIAAIVTWRLTRYFTHGIWGMVKNNSGSGSTS